MQQRGVAFGVLSLAALLVLAWGPALPAASPLGQGVPPPRPAEPGPTAQAMGVREASWSPDGKRLGRHLFRCDLDHGARRQGGQAAPAPTGGLGEPARSGLGRPRRPVDRVFAAETSGEFDLWMVPASGGSARGN